MVDHAQDAVGVDLLRPARCPDAHGPVTYPGVGAAMTGSVNGYAPSVADASPPIGAHRLLGGGRSTALLRPAAEVDWWCGPEPDDPPLLWSPLDPCGARARWRGVRLVELDEPPAGPTARTVLAAALWTLRHRLRARRAARS